MNKFIFYKLGPILERIVKVENVLNYIEFLKKNF